MTVHSAKNSQPDADIVKRLRAKAIDNLDRHHGTNAFLFQEAADEIARLRVALARYGNRARMSNAASPALQQTIDDALAAASGGDQQ